MNPKKEKVTNIGLIIGCIATLILSSISFVINDMQSAEWYNWIVFLILAIPTAFISLGIGLLIWIILYGIITAILSGTTPKEEHFDYEWNNNEILFHFIIGWPVGCVLLYFIIKLF